LSLDLWKAVDEYLDDLLVPADPTLEATLLASANAGLPRGNVAPNQGKLLMLLARSVRARAILEFGTLGGYSTIWLARGLDAGGRLVTLEADSQYAAVARANIARAGLTDAVELRVGRALDSLTQLAAEGAGPFDLVFLDADKANNAAYFDWALRLSRPGTLIVADNVVRAGAVIDGASDDLSVKGVRQFLERLASDPRVIATALQTVGSKGHDGFAIALVVSV
jgi:predicted O-methyltransferase YrrM